MKKFFLFLTLNVFLVGCTASVYRTQPVTTTTTYSTPISSRSVVHVSPSMSRTTTVYSSPTTVSATTW